MDDRWRRARGPVEWVASCRGWLSVSLLLQSSECPSDEGTTRTQVWFESLDEWSWPGRGGAAVEALPPSWIPAFPPRSEPASSLPVAPGTWGPQRALPRGIAGALLALLVALSAAATVNGPRALERVLGLGAATRPAPARRPGGRPRGRAPPPLPALAALSRDAAGSSIDTASYSSPALDGGTASFLVYLPPGFARHDANTTRCCICSTATTSGPSAFLQIGLQEMLDRLIARHVVPPLIAVMIQGGRGANNWRDRGSRRYESYVLEVQELVDRMLPTSPVRGAARDRRRLDGWLRRDARRARLSAAVRGGGELAGLLQRPGWRAASRPAAARARRPARLSIRRVRR